ncbi:MAG: RDD family protein [Bacteroidia bacterium]
MSDFINDPFESSHEQEPKLRIEDFQDHLETASTGERFANFIIDRIVTAILMVILGFGAFIYMDATNGNPIAGILLFYAAIFAVIIGYYSIMEKVYGQTIGKMITGTRVVRKNGGPISWGQALGRTASRFIPFEPFSILFSDRQVMWHDQFPNTLVVKKS